MPCLNVPEGRKKYPKNARTMPGFYCLLLSDLCNLRVENEKWREGVYFVGSVKMGCIRLKTLLMGGSLSTLTKESYHYALSREMAQGAWEFHGTCAWTHMPFDGYMMYTDIDLEYHSHLSTTYILD